MSAASPTRADGAILTPVPMYVRAFSERLDKSPRSGSPFQDTSIPRIVLTLDTETTVDEVQGLTFGSFRHSRFTAPFILELVAEGVFYADDLPSSDPAGFATLQAYANREHLTLLSRHEFCANVFLPLAYDARALVVGFNLPFDLSRLACAWGEARGSQFGGFALRLVDREDQPGVLGENHKYKPHIHVSMVSSKFSFIQFATPYKLDPLDKEPDPGSERDTAYRGRFLDNRTLLFALTSQTLGLRSGCELLGIEHGKYNVTEHGKITAAYVDYNRRDVLATEELFVALLRDFDRHPVQLDVCKAFSPASLAKSYTLALGVSPAARQFASVPREVLGIGAQSYYGGRAEARIRNVPVPVVHTDFVSMYPTVNALMGLWNFVTADSLEVVDFTDGAKALLAEATLDAYFDPASWQQLAWFGLIEPNEDILPVRASYDATKPLQSNIGVNYLTSDFPHWYAGPDLIASALLTDKPPRLRRAIRLVPKGQQRGLKPITLPSGRTIDPAKEDFYRRTNELRKQLKRDGSRPEGAVTEQALKILANSGSYGITAEVNTEELPKDTTVPVRVYGGFAPFDVETRHPEAPGPFSFLPFAALITASARLMLALLERCVTDAGGTYGFCDTDSMAIVATRRGGLIHQPDTSGLTGASGQPIRALSFDQATAIVKRFESLNPYDRSAVPGSILEIKEVSLTTSGELQPVSLFATSAKRYTFFRVRGSDVDIIEPSEHGLGHLLDPSGDGAFELQDDGRPRASWIEEVWGYLVRRALGHDPERPPFWDLPAITRLSISSPFVYRPFATAQRDRPMAERTRPATFLLSATVAHHGHPAGVDPTRFHLVAPFSKDPAKWLEGPWMDLHSGKTYPVVTGDALERPDAARLKTYGDVIEEFAIHPESKSAASDGTPCGPHTRGELRRRHVVAASVGHIGKETNKLEDVQKGLMHDWESVIASFTDPAYDAWTVVIRPQLAQLTSRQVARMAGVSERAARDLLAGRSRPAEKTFRRIQRGLERRRRKPLATT